MKNNRDISDFNLAAIVCYLERNIDHVAMCQACVYVRMYSLQFFCVIVEASRPTSQYNQANAYDCAIGSEAVAHVSCVEVTGGSKLQGWTGGSCNEESNNCRTRYTKPISSVFIFSLTVV